MPHKSFPDRLWQLCLRYLKVGSYILIGSFCCCLLSSIGFGVYRLIWLHNCERTAGTVIALSESADEDGDAMYAPVFQFMAANGQTYTLTGVVHTHPSAYEVGESVQVLYHKDAPLEAHLDGFLELWFWSVLLVAIALIHGAIGALIFWRIRKRAKHNQLPPIVPSAA